VKIKKSAHAERQSPSGRTSLLGRRGSLWILRCWGSRHGLERRASLVAGTGATYARGGGGHLALGLDTILLPRLGSTGLDFQF
jgi:hypothetical protein